MTDKDLKKELLRQLREIRDDQDFLLSVVTIAGEKTSIKKLSDFIKLSKEAGEKVCSDDVLALAFALRKEAEERAANPIRKKGLAVAML